MQSALRKGRAAAPGAQHAGQKWPTAVCCPHTHSCVQHTAITPVSSLSSSWPPHPIKGVVAISEAVAETQMGLQGPIHRCARCGGAAQTRRAAPPRGAARAAPLMAMGRCRQVLLIAPRHTFANANHTSHLLPSHFFPQAAHFARRTAAVVCARASAGRRLRRAQPAGPGSSCAASAAAAAAPASAARKAATAAAGLLEVAALGAAQRGHSSARIQHHILAAAAT